MPDPIHHRWSNYETWLVYVHISNNANSHTNWKYRYKEICDINEQDAKVQKTARRELALIRLAEELEEETKADNPLQDENTLYADLIRPQFDKINWYELAVHYARA
jgi:hypothetical protein